LELACNVGSRLFYKKNPTKKGRKFNQESCIGKNINLAAFYLPVIVHHFVITNYKE